jgi:hypothetical protein
MLITHMLERRSVALLGWVLVIALLLQPCAPLFAQTPDDCSAKLKEAEQAFYNGDFDKAIALTKECLGKPDFPDSKKKDAYELLAQSYLANSYLSEARSAIRKLLVLVPSYVPPRDAPELAKEVAKVREEMGEEKKPAEQQETPKQEVASEKGGGFPQTWHWIVGGVVVAGVATALIVGGGSKNENPPPVQNLPGPPALP